jgi:MFS family permease
LFANGVSLTGEAITMVAIPWFVLETSGSAARMGLVAFFTLLPRVVATFTGATFVDRIGFKHASVGADLVSGTCVGMIPLLHSLGYLTFWLLLLLVFLGALFDGPGSIARESLVPELVTLANAQLDRVNAVYQALQRIAFFAGPLLAGVLIAVFGTNNLLVIDAITFAASALIIGTFVPPLNVKREARATSSYWHQLKVGLRFIVHDRLLCALALMLGILNFCDAPLVSVLLPVYARTTLGSSGQLGLMLSALGAGAMVSSLVYAVIASRVSRRHVFIGAFFVLGAPYWLFAIDSPFIVTMAGLFISGCGAGPINPLLMTLRQERVPVELRARVFSAFMALAWISMPLGQLLGGIAVDVWGIQAVFACMAGIYLLVTSGSLFVPVFREMDLRREPVAPGMGKGDTRHSG